MSEQSPCFGGMFPNLVDLQRVGEARGAVFTVRIGNQGLWGTSQAIIVDEVAWQRCQQCSAYRACYDLSLASLHLALAVKQLI
jgi:hypothetical protein